MNFGHVVMFLCLCHILYLIENILFIPNTQVPILLCGQLINSLFRFRNLFCGYEENFYILSSPAAACPPWPRSPPGP